MVSNSSKVFLGLAGMLLCGAAVCFYIGYSRIDFSESTASPKKQAPAKADSIVNLETEEPPMVKQKSIEANSPNVVGNNNQIVYNQAPVQVVPPPENVRWTSQWIPSPDPRYMVCLEVTVQVDATISPFAIGFICNKPIKNADAAIRSGAMMDSFESGRLNTAPPEHSFYFRFHSPPISPQHPMVVTLFADEQFNLEQVGRLKK